MKKRKYHVYLLPASGGDMQLVFYRLATGDGPTQ
jgi:hypothetical protein